MFSRAEEDASRILSPADYQIYLETIPKCQAGTYQAAATTSFDPAIVASAASNLVQIMSFNLQASKARHDAGFLSPEMARKRRSDGFWLAFAHCYRGSSELRIILIKQIIDMGHLTSEVTGTVGSLYLAAEMAALSLQFHQTYPMVTRFFAVVGISLTIHKTFSLIKHEYFEAPTIEEAKLVKEIETNLFDDVDQTIGKIVKLAQMKVATIDEQLKRQDLPAADRQKLLTQRQRIIQQVTTLKVSSKAS